MFALRAYIFNCRFKRRFDRRPRAVRLDTSVLVLSLGQLKPFENVAEVANRQARFPAAVRENEPAVIRRSERAAEIEPTNRLMLIVANLLIYLHIIKSKPSERFCSKCYLNSIPRIQ